MTIGTRLDAGSLGQLEVTGVLGEGGFGRVFSVAGPAGLSLALKWFNPAAAVPEQWQAIEYLLDRGAPDSRFLWPLAMVGSSRDAQFGYLMQIRRPEFLMLSRLANRRDADGNPLALSPAVVIEMCRQIAEAFLRLHGQGWCYRDVSLTNVFFDPHNGDVLVCDVDNVAVDANDGRGRVLGTGRFMAPEIVSGHALPSTLTDRYSLAVLLFIALFCAHPLEGARTESGLMSADFVREHFGDHPLFAMHPTDPSNRPVDGPVPIYWEKVYPIALLHLFELTFTEGLSDPRRRVGESQWVRAFTRLREVLGSCPGCRASVFYDPEAPDRVCWSCSTPLGVPLTVQHGGRRVVVGPELVLSHDTTMPVNPAKGAASVIGKAVSHPRDARMIGLSNRTAAPWRAAYPDGSTEAVAPGSVVVVLDGLTITGEGGLRLAFSRSPLSKPT